MSDVADSVAEVNIASPATALDYEPEVRRIGHDPVEDSPPRLLRNLVWLSLPVLAEQILHMFVGLTDTYLANHVSLVTPGMSAEQIAAARAECVHAGAAVGMISYLLWFVGLVAGAVGTGSTAIIARATGARHRRLANSICGQSITLAVVLGIGLAIFAYFFAGQISGVTGLPGRSAELAYRYIQMMSWSLPFLMVMFVANACLRGAGDTLTPALAMIVVDIVNMVLSYSLTYGALGLPAMGFDGIAIGTTVAYVVGGVMQLVVLLVGRGGIRLFIHRLQPHARDMKRLLRIGLPSGLEGSLQWSVNFALMYFINSMDTTAAAASAHNTAVRIEAVSFLAGFAFATGAATMVGQSLGMKRPIRAARSAYLAFAVGGSLMTLLGVFYVLFGDVFSRWLSEDPRVIRLSTESLFWAGFAQAGFGAAMIFGGSLRGAGDTLRVMLINLLSIILIRLVGVIVLVKYFHAELPTIWLLLSIELAVRGVLMYARFAHGGWKHVKV